MEVSWLARSCTLMEDELDSRRAGQDVVAEDVQKGKVDGEGDADDEDGVGTW